MADEISPKTELNGQQPEEQPDREAQPVDAEQSPRLPFPVVGIGASAGGLEAVSELLDAMRPDAGLAFVLVQHLAPDRESMMAEILARHTTMPVRQVEDGMKVEVDHVYVIRPGHVLTIHDGRLHLGPQLDGPRAANRPIDDFFKSLAEEQRERAICVIMSGMGSNGTAGAQTIKAVGGLCVAQDPESAQFPSMPRHLIDAGYADYVLRPAEIPDALLTFAGSPYARGGQEAEAQPTLDREQHHLREILAILRTRTRKDFTGYKRPTVLRRVQRRMGLARVSSLADYARHLRQSPNEVASLADDLLIHVSGFFRDPEAWAALRERAIFPLVASRESGATVRAWVTACSSGEEAYSLAMLLMEESDRTGKNLDIKVFATDLAERALAHARSGVYAGGIESEISQERLARFFIKEDEVYRARQELRDRVVFAPHNILLDPPFSRLDIASCRNLLIYLDPEVQTRVLSLLHFGLRDGGTLFLGSAETAFGVESLFEVIDKRARIYRRIGPTRHAALKFPMPHGLATSEGGMRRPRSPRSEGPRLSIAQLSQQELLQHHTPPAVTVDRDHRVLYFHGDTHPYLLQPTGEPTRDLMRLVRDGVRGAVRVALSRAMSQNATVTEFDGWVDTATGGRMRVLVTASPIVGPRIDETNNGAEYFAVSFAERGDAYPLPLETSGEHSAEEFRTLRAELQSTIEELQSSNEEMKTSHEEVVSINEELQSTNEELEASREEMQSLNEELVTVNAQLRSKVEEHQATSSDLATLLTSTDIAVLFLDPDLRIRRYTPAARDLIDLIAGDVGRPLASLARKFDDPHLDEDCRAVLERLVPAEREVPGENNRHYLRRVHPYRTADNRIDGVVITLIDVSIQKQAEKALEASEEQFRRAVEDAPIPVIMQAEDGRVLQVSRAWTELTGFNLSDVPTFEAWLTRAYGPGADEVRAHVHELFHGDRRTLDVEFTIRTRSGDERYWSFSASAPGALKDGRRFVVGMAVDISERKRAGDELCEARDRLGAEMARRADFARRLSLAQEDERRRISRDLHDSVGQLLAGLLLAVKAVEVAGPLAPETARKLDDVHKLAKDLGREVHALAVRLRPTALDDLGLEIALEQLVREWSTRSGVPADFHASLGPGRLPPDVETALYRIIQEALTNVAKHAKASNVSVSVNRQDAVVIAAVEDDGVGFDPSNTPNGRLGLLGMRERATAIGGELEIESRPGKGTTIVVRVSCGENMSKLRVFLADDHPVMRSGLKGIIDAQEDMGIVGEAYDGATAARLALELKPDIVVMDISMPGLSGPEAAQRIRAENPSIRIVALTAHEGRGYLQQLLAAGAQGYVLKTSAADDLIRAIRAVAAGELYIDPAAANNLIAITQTNPPTSAVELSEREEEVLRSIAQGHLLKQIATRLGVGLRTVETYKVRAMEKLGLKSRADIVRYAVQTGWLTGG